MTSKKLKAILDIWLAAIARKFDELTQLATESLAGIIKISSTAQVSAGTDDTTAVTPYKLKEFYTAGASKTQNGYQKLPSGVILQWGGAVTTPTGIRVNFPIAFPTALFRIVTSGNNTQSVVFTVQAQDRYGFSMQAWNSTGLQLGSMSGFYIALGY